MFQPQKTRRTAEYQSFDPLEGARLSVEYLSRMTDASLGHLPYWLVAPMQRPAFAEHCRVDDSELVASWYEGLSSAREMAGTSEGEKVETALLKHVLHKAAWGPEGLRFHVPRPWIDVAYCTFHEMGYVLSALNRAGEVGASPAEVERRASGLVRGLRALVTEHKIRAPWAGTVPLEEPTYSFSNDVYLRERGMDPAITTGWGETALRNAVLIAPLVNRYQRTGDEVAVDLACGLANHLLGMAHYFNFKMEFFGHVHSALWAATGLVKLGRLLQNDRYVAKGKGIYDYVRRWSSAFGWVPEYVQWQLIADERCESCCVGDMMRCALELVDCGFPEYWDDVHRFWRNQLTENQIRETGFVVSDDSVADTERRTYRQIGDRLRGGFSGGSHPNSNPMARFRSVAGCCSGTAPQAMLSAWRATTEFHRGILTVNFPVDKETPQAKIEVGYPNAGYVRIRLKRACRVMVRVFAWMPTPHEGTVDGRPAALERRDDLVFFPPCEKGAVLELRHELKTRRVMEHVAGNDFFGIWRGPDMIDILPHGYGYRLYQRVCGIPKDYPNAPSERTSGTLEVQTEPPPMKETRLNRRKPPRAAGPIKKTSA